MHQIIMEMPELKDAAGQLYIILGEAYSNALEHGVLGLKSLGKHDAQGFAEYYGQREKALSTLQSGFVRFEFDWLGSLESGRLRIRIIRQRTGL